MAEVFKLCVVAPKGVISIGQGMSHGIEEKKTINKYNYDYSVIK